ncbi:tetratricopeptide repeat protein [Streptosporangium sp. NPDC002721]|uniref:tetratricopeptide repeat protein n=1 Tax=Streptosporangium sp. NPDC002721 TaxID=3366188 RepID=UPI00369ADFF8
MRPGDSQHAEAAGSAQQAVQRSGVQYNTFVGAAQARSVASSAPPLAVPQRRAFAAGLRGRDDLLSEIDGLIWTPARRPRVVLVHGMGGVGKTAIVQTLAHSAAERGTTTWWVRAGSPDGTRAALHAVAFDAGALDSDFDHAHPSDVLWRALNSRSTPWLLVIDNADDPRVLSGEDRTLEDGTDWVRPPATPYGTVLITSRDGRVERWASWMSMHKVTSLAPEVGAAVLMDLAPDAGPPQAARELAAAMGGLPLALELVGRYLSCANADPFPAPDSTGSFSGYRSTYERRLQDLTMDEPGSEEFHDGRRALTTTWEMSVELLAQQGHDLAGPLMRLLACCASSPLPYRLVLRPEALERSPLFAGAVARRLSGSLKALSGLGVISLDPGIGDPGASGVPVSRRIATLDMHPLVRTVTRGNLRGSGELERFRALLADLLDAATGELDTDDADDWNVWAALAGHCLGLLDLIRDDETIRPDTALSATLPARRVAWYRYMAGLYDQAVTDFRSILDVVRPLLGDEHPDVLDIRNRMARAVRENGHNSEAERQLLAVLAVASRVLGEEHPDTLSVRINLARTIREGGRHAEAETAFRSIVATAQRVLGEDHPDTIVSALNLARTLRDQGRYEQAEAGYREVLRAWQRNFGEDDLNALDIRYEIAETLRERGMFGAAIAAYTGILTANTRVYGEDHPNSLTIRRGLAAALTGNGELEAAEREILTIVRGQRARLGADHPLTKESEAALEELRRH